MVTEPPGVKPEPLRVTLEPAAPLLGLVDMERLWMILKAAEAMPASPESVAKTEYEPAARFGIVKDVPMLPELSATAAPTGCPLNSIVTEASGVKPDPVTDTFVRFVPLEGSNVIVGEADA
jgi:hypothetical protein